MYDGNGGDDQLFRNHDCLFSSIHGDSLMFVKLIDLCHFFLTFSDFTTLRCLHSSIRLVSVWYPSGGKVVSPLSDLSGQEMRRGMWPGMTGTT